LLFPLELFRYLVVPFRFVFSFWFFVLYFRSRFWICIFVLVFRFVSSFWFFVLYLRIGFLFWFFVLYLRIGFLFWFFVSYFRLGFSFWSLVLYFRFAVSFRPLVLDSRCSSRLLAFNAGLASYSSNTLVHHRRGIGCKLRYSGLTPGYVVLPF